MLKKTQEGGNRQQARSSKKTIKRDRFQQHFDISTIAVHNSFGVGREFNPVEDIPLNLNQGDLSCGGKTQTWAGNSTYEISLSSMC